MTMPRPRSAVYELDIAVYGGPTEYHEEQRTIPTTGAELIGANPDRLAYWIGNNGPDTIYWSANAGPSPTRGFPLGAGSILIVRARDDGAFTINRLYATSTANPTGVTIAWIERSHGPG